MEPKSAYKSSNSLSNNSRSGALGSNKKKASPWSTKKETTESSKETLSPQKNKPNRREESDSEKRKFQMLTYMTNNDLTIIQHVFENLDEGVLDKKMFLLLMIEVLKKHGPPMEMLIKDSKEVYDFIDIDKKNKISFSDFSSFFMMQESGIENLSHAILHFEQKETPSFSSSCILKLYYLEKLDLIAIIEENKRTIKILNAYSLDIVRELSIPKSIVSDVCFMPDFSCFVILSCDRKIYFYSTSKEFELITQFDIPETQISLVYSQTKGLLFSYGLSAKIYGWNAKTILSKNFQKVSGDRDAYTYLIDKDTPFCYQKHISCMITIDNLGLLATGSNDTYLRLYDLKDLQKEPRVLVGHQKGVKDMTYSKEYQYILSYSYDCDIIIWNAIVGQSLAKLTGHEALILGVSIPTNTDYLITCDARGCTKIWDANTLLQIEDKHPEASNLKCVVFLPKYRRIVFGGRQLSAYEYARPQDQNLTEDFPIRCGVISLKNMEIFIATTYSISVWSLEDGIQVRAMTNIMKADITGMMLDHDERKLFISDQSGRLELFDAVNGRFIKSLTPHQKEISGLLYSDEERMILSISWDKTIRTHLESSLLNKEDLRNGVLKNLYNAHENEILCADISQQSGLLVTGSKEAEIKIWNFQASQLDHELKMFRSDVNCVKFLDPYPLLATSDIEGNICLWTTEPYEQPYKCLVNWKNMFNLQKFSAITAMMFTLHYNKKEDFQESLLYIGDGMGYIRVFDLAELIETMNISPITPDFKIKRKTFNKIEDVDFKGRNASLDRQKLTSRAADGLSSKKDVNIKQVVQWKAHQDTVNQITIINAVDPPIIMTVSSDKMAKFWNFKGENVANLYQGRNYNDSWGIRIKENYVDNSAVGFTKQFKEDIENKYQPEIKKIRNLIGDFTDTYEYEVMAKIDNDDIFKHFSDLENTIAQTIPKSDSKNFVKLKTRKK